MKGPIYSNLIEQKLLYMFPGHDRTCHGMELALPP